MQGSSGGRSFKLGSEGCAGINQMKGKMAECLCRGGRGGGAWSSVYCRRTCEMYKGLKKRPVGWSGEHQGCLCGCR